MIDRALRRTGVSGTDAAAIVGLDPRRNAFDIYQQKIAPLDETPEEPPAPRLVWGRRLERVIAEAYAEETNQRVLWCDTTRAHPQRSWQLATPDALVIGESQGSAIENALARGEYVETATVIAGVDAKNVSFDQAYLWGPAGSSEVPDWIACQAHWYCSTLDVPHWDIAALFGGHDFRVYRIPRDPEVEKMLLHAGELFMRAVQERKPPPVGATEATAEWMKRRFPKPVSTMRPATDEELGIIEALKIAKVVFREAERNKVAAENEIKLAIGEAEGLTFGGGKKADKITWKKDKDSMGTDWESVARELDLERGLLLSVLAMAENREAGEKISKSVLLRPGKRDEILKLIPEWPTLEELAHQNEVVTREGPRKLLTPRSWTKE